MFLYYINCMVKIFFFLGGGRRETLVVNVQYLWFSDLSLDDNEAPSTM